jgi:PhnB protein
MEGDTYIMSDSVKAIPAGFHSLTPHLVVNDSRKAAEFYKKAFGAEIIGISDGPGGKVMHATARIGDSMLMFNDEFPEFGTLSPTSTKASTCVYIALYVPDADKTFNDAVAAGAQVTMPLSDQFWGDRYGQVIDPFGHRWSIAQRIKNMTKEEMDAAGKIAMESMPSHT